MIHQFTDRDINEIFTGYVSWSTEDVLHINYISPTQSTFYTREDLLHMIDIIDGVEEGVKPIKVYRLENNEGVGPFRGGHREEADMLKGHCNPLRDDFRLNQRRVKNFYKNGWQFGWDCEKTFDYWMNAQEEFFKTLGYTKVSYETDKYRKYGEQELFTFVEEGQDYVSEVVSGNQVVFNRRTAKKVIE